MAHAGTSMDLPKQSAATGTNGFWRALLTAIVIVAIGVTMVLAASFISGANPAKGVPAADNSYNQIENLRGTTQLSATPVDRSYSQIENLRGTTQLSVTDERRFDWYPDRDHGMFAIEGVPGGMPGFLDRGYDANDGVGGGSALGTDEVGWQGGAPSLSGASVGQRYDQVTRFHRELP